MKLLIVEDSERLRESLQTGLRHSGFAVDGAASAESALVFLRSYCYALMLLDLGLPGMDGARLLAINRAEKLCESVLVISARDRSQDRVALLNQGADDYLVKPFDFDELLARINALLRRSFQQPDPILRVGDLLVNTALNQASVAGTDLALAPREYQTLEYLLRQRGRIVSRAQIFEALSTADRSASDRVVEVVISLLRRKLREAGMSDLIRFERGLGYAIG